MKRSIVLAGAALLFAASPALAADSMNEDKGIVFSGSASSEIETNIDPEKDGFSAVEGSSTFSLTGTTDWGTLLLLSSDDDEAAPEVADPLGLVSFARGSQTQVLPAPPPVDEYSLTLPSVLARVTTDHFGSELVAQVDTAQGLGLAVSHEVNGVTVGALLTDEMLADNPATPTVVEPTANVYSAAGYVTVPVSDFVPVGDLELSGSVATKTVDETIDEPENLAYGVTLTGELVSNFDVEVTYSQKQADFAPGGGPNGTDGETYTNLVGTYTFDDLQGELSMEHTSDAANEEFNNDDILSASLAYRSGNAVFDDVFDDDLYYETGSVGLKGTFSQYLGENLYGTNGDTEIELITAAPLAAELVGKVAVTMYSDEDGDTDKELGPSTFQATSKMEVDARLHYQATDAIALVPSVVYTSYSEVTSGGAPLEDFAQTDLGVEVEKALSDSATVSVSVTNESGKTVLGAERANNILGLGFSVDF